MMRALILGSGLLLALGLWLSLHYPTVHAIDVRGAKHYDAQHLAEAANLFPGRPLLWVRQRDLAPLARSPWIYKVELVRYFPSSVSLRVWEKTPVAVYYPDTRDLTTGAPIGYTWQGEALPDLNPSKYQGLIEIRGWGKSRLDEALALMRLLRAQQPSVINYTPQGFDVTLTHSTLYTPSVAYVQHHWQALEQAWSQIAQVQPSQHDAQEAVHVSRQRLVVYPWGVSVGEDAIAARSAPAGYIQNLANPLPPLRQGN